MVNERLQEDMAIMMRGLSDQLKGIAEAQRKRAQLTATVRVCDQRIEVTVNADGLLIETKFADDILDLTMDEIAENITAAVQQAAAEVQQKTRELVNPLMEQRAALPKLSEMIDGAPDLGGLLPKPPEPPKAPPKSGVWPRDVEDTGDGSSSRSVVADRD